MDAYMQSLEASFEAYVSFVEAKAKEAFEEKVLPFLERRNLSFLAGHGTHTFHDYTKKNRWERHVDPISRPNDKELRELDEFLNQAVPGLPNNSFGSLMPCRVIPLEDEE